MNKENLAIKDLYQTLIKQIKDLGLKVDEKEILKDATYEIYISTGADKVFEVYVDFSTSAWLYFKDLKDGSDEVNTKERWSLMFNSFYEIIESLYTRPYKEVRFIRRNTDMGGFIEYSLPNGKTEKLTDLKLRFWFGYSKRTINHQPLSTQ